MSRSSLLPSYASDNPRPVAAWGTPVLANGGRQPSGESLLSRSHSLPLHLEIATSLSGLAVELGREDSKKAQRFVRTYESIAAALAEPQPQVPEGDKQIGFGRRITQVFTKGLHKFVSSARPQSQASQAGVEKEELVEKLNSLLAGKRYVSRDTFKGALEIRGSVFAEQLFKAIDTKETGNVSTEQLISCLLALETGTMEERIAFTFSLISGSSEQPCVSFQQLKEILQASCTEGGIKVHMPHIHSMAAAIFKKAGRQPHESLSLEGFTKVLQQRPDLLAKMKLACLPNKLRTRVDNEAAEQAAFKHLSWHERLTATAAQRLRARGVTNFRFVFWLCLVFYAELAGFGVEFAQEDHGSGQALMGYTYPIAKASAQSIQVVLILFFFTVARNLLTVLRQTFLRNFIQFDDALRMHRHLAFHFLFWSALHTAAHIVNAVHATDRDRALHWLPYGSTFKPPIIQQPSLAVYFSLPTQVTGLLLSGILSLGFLFASPWPRQTKWFRRFMLLNWMNNFNVFYISHITMTVSVVVLLIVHPLPGVGQIHRSTTWLYLLAGLVAYLVGNILQLFRRALFTCRVIDVKVYDLPAEVRMPGGQPQTTGVVELRLSLPKWAAGFKLFNYSAGQYASLRVPAISRLEWHPFTISSAPCDDFIMFHIKAVGDWTNKLFDICKAQAWLGNERQHFVDREDEDVEWLAADRNQLVVDLNGPFGAPAQDYRNYNVLLLVGSSICVTPFASILRQLVHEHNQAKCTNCSHVNHRLFAPKKVYFYWTERDQSAPMYLQRVLQDIKGESVGNFLDINIHITSIHQDKNDIRHIFSTLGRSLLHEAEGFDPVAGAYVPAPCHFGRPDWKSVFNKITINHPGSKVGVFVCGGRTLTGELKGMCNMRNQQAREAADKDRITSFAFHQEKF